MRQLIRTALALTGAALACNRVGASDLVAVQPLTDAVIMLHFDDGYVIHHKRGEPRSQEQVVVNPLDVDAASKPTTYTIVSTDDPAYRSGRQPARVGRKSKGTQFAWFVDSWVNNRAVNTRPDHAKEHWLYLHLPASMKPGTTYTVRTGSLAANGREWKLRFDIAKARSEAVHVNTLGYVPSAPAKYAYVYHWMGDHGGLDVKPIVGRAFHLVDTKTGRRAFSGKVAFRMPATQRETYHLSDTPNGNYLGADVAECDFSAFRTPGRYVVAVEGVGCSWPFRIDADVYRSAFRAAARALYHNRSGIALTKPYTEFERPAPHNPKLTPGFAGKLRYTRLRWTEWGSEGGDAAKLMAESPGELHDTWGWYQDAGDWDSYETHMRIPQELLLVYAMAPRNFTDGELNIPESGNGVPDILDEAAWLARFCHRLRHELMARDWGTGGVGLRVAGDAFGTDEGTTADGRKVGRGSWEDTDRIYMVSGEDPWSTYRYAGVAANLARFIKRDPGGVDWTKEARESYAWAQANTRPGDEEKEEGRLRHARAYAAASLFVLTGDATYEEQLRKDTAWIAADTYLWGEQHYHAPAVYVLHGKGDPALQERLRASLLRTADETLITTPSKRALRWGGNFSMPMLIGQQTTPLILDGAIGYAVARKHDLERARKYQAALYTTCDYFLGTNALNQTWMTGVGPRYPSEIFHMDAWYNGKGKYHAGLIPYSPWRKVRDEGQGPWDADWANPTAYPHIDRWPGNERWFSNRCSPLASEFTVHQNLGPSAAIYGFMCAETSQATTGRPATPPTPLPSDEGITKGSRTMRLKVSSDRRYLIREDGKPFFWLADTAWELFHRLTLQEASRYLEDRAAKGFTVIQAVVLAELDGLKTPNASGHIPLINNDPSKPNEDYFKDVDAVVRRAAELGLYIGMLPTWGDKWHKGGGANRIFTPANARPYGRFLGARYRNDPIIWILGGDKFVGDDEERRTIEAMAEGLREGDGGAHLITFHPIGQYSSAIWFHDSPWLDFNMIQTGHTLDRDNYNSVLAEYCRTPVKPVLDGEPGYENIPHAFNPANERLTALHARRFCYWALLAGACGHTYGCNDIWQMWAQGRTPMVGANLPWYEAMNLPGAGQMRHARALIENGPYFDRMPDPSLVVPPNASGPDYVGAARAPDGRYALLYVPSGKSVTVRVYLLRGSRLNAAWYDPRTGERTPLPDVESAPWKTVSFTPPPQGPDWVLELRSTR